MSTPAASGAAAATACSMVVWIVPAVDWQPPAVRSSRRWTTPWSSRPWYSISPACAPSWGSTCSTARLIRVLVSSGCRSCTSSKLSTSGSATSLSSMLGPDPSPFSAPRMETICASPAPYSSTRQLTSSSAVAATCGPACDRISASSASTRSPAAWTSWPAAIDPPQLALALIPGPFTPDPPLHREGHSRRRVRRLEHLAAAQVHMHPARQARVEAAHRAHDVDALEGVRRVLLEDRRVLHRVLVRPGRPVAIPHAAVPRRGRVRVVVRDLPVPDHHVVREHAADRLGEAAAERVLGHVEGLPRLGPPGPDLGEGLLDEVQRDPGGVGLEVGPGPVPLDRVGQRLALLVHRDLPLEGGFRPGHGPRQVDLHAVAGGLHVAAVDQAGQRGHPQPGDGTAAGVERQEVRPVEPAGGHGPAVLVVEVTLGRPRDGVLVPRVTPVDRVPELVVGDEHLLVFPVLVIGVTEQDPD